VGGACLGILPLGFLSLFAMLLVGYLVGEAVARASRRLPYRELAILAFCCASLGPVLGRAVLLAVILPLPDTGSRVMLAATATLLSLGPWGALASVAAGLVAANRVTR
jgi:hypothetical protein